MQYDFVAIGDIVMEPFIRLKDAKVNCKIDSETCEICMRWGDKIPYEFAKECYAVGNASNAAVSAARLGLNAALVTDVGSDDIGKKDIEQLQKEKVVTEYVHIHDGLVSNHHYVLWYEDERTILVRHEEYPYQFPDIGEPKWVYLSSLADNSLPYHEQIAAYLMAHPNIQLAFQPGTFQMSLGADKLKALYERCNLFYCNKDEARRITGSDSHDIKELFKAVCSLGPKTVVITDGPHGAFAIEEDGSQWSVPMYPDPKPPYERTGAGDAFASTITAALAVGKPLQEALLWGPINAMGVVQKIGAQEGLFTRDELEKLLAQAPQDYKVVPL